MTLVLDCGHTANATDGNGNASCAIHDTSTASVEVNLDGRVAKCYCGNTKPSSKGLAFFEYLGVGSREANESCAECNSHLVTHLEINTSTGRAGHNFGKHEFVAKGDVGHDRFYCGCRGWD